MVVRDGIEPPTPAFSGLLTELANTQALRRAGLRPPAELHMPVLASSIAKNLLFPHSQKAGSRNLSLEESPVRSSDGRADVPLRTLERIAVSREFPRWFLPQLRQQ